MNEDATIKKLRVEYIDILKGIGIILMIMGHIGFSGIFDFYIHAFNMPLFFFVSGYLYKTKLEKKYKDIVLGKAKSLLIPYLFFGILHYFVYIIINKESNFLDPLYHLFFMNNEELPIAGALWFLTAMFFTTLIYDLLKRKIKNKYIFLAIIIIIAITGCLLPFQLPYSINAGMVGIGIFFLGNCLAENKDKLKILITGKWWLIIIYLILNGLIFVNGYTNMRTGEYSIVPLFWINLLIGTLTYWNVSIWIQNNSKIYLINKLSTLLKYIGRNSIVFLALNQLVIMIISTIINLFQIDNMIIFALMKIINLIITTVILCLNCNVMLNTKLKKVIGKS